MLVKHRIKRVNSARTTVRITLLAQLSTSAQARLSFDDDQCARNPNQLKYALRPPRGLPRIVLAWLVFVQNAGKEQSQHFLPGIIVHVPELVRGSQILVFRSEAGMLIFDERGRSALFLQNSTVGSHRHICEQIPAAMNAFNRLSSSRIATMTRRSLHRLIATKHERMEALSREKESAAF